MNRINLIAVVILTMCAAMIGNAQTSAFTYQGRFTDGGTAANGTYEMQFKLFDGANNQIGSAITNPAVAERLKVIGGLPGLHRLDPMLIARLKVAES